MLVRADALEAYASETGAAGEFATWEDLAMFVQHMDGRDFDGDGVPDHASCINRCGSPSFGYMALGGPLYMIYASFIQTHGPTQGIHFDPSTMQPLFENEGFAEAVRLFHLLSRPCPLSAADTCQAPPNEPGDFSAGKCVFLLTHPGPANDRIIGEPIGKRDGNGTCSWQPILADGESYARAVRLRLPGTA